MQRNGGRLKYRDRLLDDLQRIFNNLDGAHLDGQSAYEPGHNGTIRAMHGPRIVHHLPNKILVGSTWARCGSLTVIRVFHLTAHIALPHVRPVIVVPQASHCLGTCTPRSIAIYA